MEIQEMRVQVPLTCISNKVVVPQVIEPINNHEEQQINDPITHKEVEVNEPIV
ncbi:Retrovirus-related Pol polyprotein from transposon TNT 1-94 [Sesbania bispinosa]|nr:Retrovirus-related Pol polyprotein from transposon TNT 1-94 [Sesbania bispinosa]